MNILIVEDDQTVVDTVREFLQTEEPTWKLEEVNFEDVKEKLMSYQTDAIVLDIFKGDKELNIPEGENVYDYLWKKYFRPVVVFSAGIEVSRMEEIDHPFVKIIKKSEENYDSIIEALRMDDSPNGDTYLDSWEQYIFPPIPGNCLLGDVVMKSGGSKSKPSDFRVILSPSCDLVKRPEPKIKKILVAKCCSVVDGLNKSNKKNMKNSNNSVKTIQEILTRGYENSVVPLPKLRGIIPSMFVDMKDLELVPWKKIGDKEESGPWKDVSNEEESETKYYRVASIDSPFREMISQVYQSVSIRLGLPDRNFKSWAEEFSNELPK